MWFSFAVCMIYLLWKGFNSDLYHNNRYSYQEKTFVQSDWLELFKWERPLKALKLLPEFNRSFWSTFQVPLPSMVTRLDARL